MKDVKALVHFKEYIRPVKEHLISEDCWECMDVSCVFVFFASHDIL